MISNHNKRILKKIIDLLGISTIVLITATSLISIKCMAKENDSDSLYNENIKIMDLEYNDHAYEFEYNGRKYRYSEIQFMQSDNYSYFIIDEDKKEISITKIANAESEVFIPTELDGYKVVCLGVPLNNFSAYEEGIYKPKSQYSIFEQEDINKVTSLFLPEGIKHIGIAAFMDMANLKQVSLPDSLETIGVEAFAYDGIEELVLPKNLELIDLCAFYCCESLTNVTVNSSNVGGGGEYPSFKFCDNLELVTWGNVEYANVDLFELSTIKKVLIPSSVKTFNMIGCNIQTLIIKGENTNFVTDKDLGKYYWNDKFSIIVSEHSIALDTIKGLDVDYEEVTQPKALTVKKAKITKINLQKNKLTWNKQSDITKYQIYYSELKNGKYQLLLETDKQTYSTTKLTGYIKIRSYRTYKGVKWYGKFRMVKL
ncbi:MAG: leucine-rich repeat domain-containing protein [Mobilitalea sp.]